VKQYDKVEQPRIIVNTKVNYDNQIDILNSLHSSDSGANAVDTQVDQNNTE